MLTDLRKLDDGVEFAADLCIVGGGIAGITIARALVDTDLKVLLLESGGLNYEDDIQALNQGESVGVDYPPLDTTRLRYFGGSSNHWGGMSYPLDPIDFLHRSWIPNSGWPIERDELLPFYKVAHKICDRGPMVYTTSATKGSKYQAHTLDQRKITSGYYRNSEPPVLFARKFGKRLASAANITVVLHATVTNFVTNDEASHVILAEVKDTTGKVAQVTARRFVLACGGLENPRILLNCDQKNPKGLANSNDLVGRFFMEHTEPFAAVLDVFNDRYVKSRYLPFDYHGTWLQYRFGLPAELQEQFGLLNAGATLEEWEIWYDVRGVPFRQGGKSEPGRERLLPLIVRAEPIPDPASRITLGDHTDALGLRGC